jgi:hypothetical protein
LIDIPIPEKEEDSVNQLECHESTYFRDSLSSAISLSKASIGFSRNMRIFTLTTATRRGFEEQLLFHSFG